MATPSKNELGNSLDLVDIQEIKSDVVLLKDGSMKQVVMVGGVNFSLKSDMEQNIITQGYQNFLNSVDFPLQVVVHSRKVNIEKYLETLVARKDTESSALLKSQIDEYVEFVRGFVQKNAIMEKIFLIVVPFYPAGSLPTKTTVTKFIPFFGGKKDASKEAADKAKSDAELERNFQENLNQLAQRTGQVMAGLATIGLEVTILQNDELVELFYNFYNPQTIERERKAVHTENRQV